MQGSMSLVLSRRCKMVIAKNDNYQFAKGFRMFEVSVSKLVKPKRVNDHAQCYRQQGSMSPVVNRCCKMVITYLLVLTRVSKTILNKFMWSFLKSKPLI